MKTELINLFERCDFTQLSIGTTKKDIESLITEIGKFNIKTTICIHPHYVPYAYQLILKQKLPIKICSVVNFPCGLNSIQSIEQEIKFLEENGAKEIDIVVPFERSFEIINLITNLKEYSPNLFFKAIIETSLYNTSNTLQLIANLYSQYFDYLKTSTGFSNEGATINKVRILSQYGKVKASGGISTIEQAFAFRENGASRIGTSKLLTEFKQIREKEEEMRKN